MSATAEAHRLEATDGLPELLARAGVGQRGLVGGARDTDRERGRGDPSERQGRERVEEAPVAAPDEIRCAGTRQSSKTSSAISEARTPSFEREAATLKARPVALHQK